MDNPRLPVSSDPQSPTPVDGDTVVLPALERIRVSQTFQNSKKLFGLLQFLVMAAQRGDEKGLKETTIGAGFYGREANYDPKKDGIVRTQASRLRERLVEYYRSEGASDPTIIELPRGSYVPVFQHREPAVKAEEPGTAPVARSKRSGRWIRVLIATVGVAAIAGLALWFSAAWQARPRVSGYSQLTHDGQPKWLVGTDGVRLFIGTGNLFDPGLEEMPIGGGDSAPVRIPLSGLRPLALSFKGDQVLLSDYAPANLWSLHLPGGTLQRLGAAAGAEAAWSPDGTKLAYGDPQGLWIAASDGSSARKLVNIPSRRLYALEWSPDGTRLRFTLWLTVNVPSLWEVSAEGSNLHPLLPGWQKPTDEAEGRWTTDGRYYVFQSGGQIWALPDHRFPHLSGTAIKPIKLTNSPVKLASPLPARDGKTLYAVGRTERGTLVRYDARTRSFEPYLSGISAEFLDFSRDGEWVTYVTYPDLVLWRSRRDGSDRLRLTNPPFAPYMPRWSPDGTQIVFSSRSSAGVHLTYSVPAGGGEPEPMFQGISNGLHDASWSPDGSRMVMTNEKGPPVAELWIRGPGGKDPTIMPSGRGYYNARWSRDGQRILAIRQQPTIGPSVFDFKTGKWTDLATLNGGFVNWSHDGQSVYFLRFPNDPAVVKIDVASRRMETVVDLSDFQMTGVMRVWLGLAPDDSPLLLRDAGTQDVYALELTP